MKKLFLTLLTLTSGMTVVAKNGYRPKRNAAVAVQAPAPVVQKAPVPVAPSNPLVGMIQAALGKIAQGAKSPEAVRLQTLTEGVKALQVGLQQIVVKDLAPSDKALLTEACNAMAKEASDLLALNTAGEWMPYFIKSAKSSVLKLKELRQEIYNMDEIINGRTASTLFKQYVYRPVMNNKMKSAIMLTSLITANKLGVLDLGWSATKFVAENSFTGICWLFAGPKIDLRTVFKAKKD